MIRPKDIIALAVFTTPFSFGYTNWISFKVCHGQGASRIGTDALHGFFGDARLRQKSPFAFKNCLLDVLYRLFEDARIQFVFPGLGVAGRRVHERPSSLTSATLAEPVPLVALG